MVLLPLHVIGGVMAIVSGFVALYALKGATLHRKSGTIFVYAILSMSLSGALMAVWRAEAANILAGLMTTYLVITALTTVSTPSARVHRLDRGAMLGAFALGLTCAVSAFVMFAGADRRARGLAVPLLVFGVIALLAGAGDLRMIRAGGLRGTLRLNRHLWRMCVALFIAAGSFFLGPARRIPEALRSPAFRLIPFLVLATMAYWLWRYRSKRIARTAVVLTAPEAI
jgi:uncharacterized membrane protein